VTAPRAGRAEAAASADAGFTIRRAEPGDAAAFLAYLRKMGGESQFVTFGPEGIALSEEEEAAYIATTNALDNAIFLLAVADGEIVGGLTFSCGERPRLRHVGEFGVSVLRAWWGRGVARALLDEMLAWARRSGVVRKINLRVRTDNERAIRLYERLGFVHEGLATRDMLIDGRFHDSLLMGLAIDPPGPGSLDQDMLLDEA
jgi:RimJ/RimL family protein N-acetyltransferase